MSVTWYLLPLSAIVSLVYSASRYELPERILSRALSLFLQIVLFMALVLAVLYLLTFKL